MLQLSLFDIYVITLAGYWPLTLLVVAALVACLFVTRNRWLRCLVLVLIVLCTLPFAFLSSFS